LIQTEYTQLNLGVDIQGICGKNTCYFVIIKLWAGGSIRRQEAGESPGFENPLLCFFPAFFSSKKIKDAVNWTVEPGQDPLNPVRIGYIHIKRYFRAMYLHK
jgi:hypothetical protein